MTRKSTLDVQLLISPGCTACPVVMQAFERLLKEGKISSVHCFNLLDYPEKSVEFNTRSVPWMRIGDFEFTGLYSYQELEHWVQAARAPDGRQKYLIHLLENQRIDEAAELADTDPEWLATVIGIAADPGTPMAARIGASAVIEQFADSDKLRQQLPLLLEASRAKDSQTRADSAYFLGLSNDETAKQRLKELLQDENKEVREIASEALTGD